MAARPTLASCIGGQRDPAATGRRRFVAAASLLTLAPGSTASGIKLRILNSAGPVDFGPDSAEAGTSHQWLLGASSSIGGVPLTVQYYRDDSDASGASPAPLAAGSVHAQATFTLSYQ